MDNVFCSICNKKIVIPEGKHVGFCNMCAKPYDNIPDNGINQNPETVLAVVEEYFSYENSLSLGEFVRMVSLLKCCDQTEQIRRKEEEIREMIAKHTEKWIELYSEPSASVSTDPFCFYSAFHIIHFYAENNSNNAREEENCNQVRTIGYNTAKECLSSKSVKTEDFSIRNIHYMFLFLQSIVPYSDAEKYAQKAKNLLSKIVRCADRHEKLGGEHIGYYRLAQNLLNQYGDELGDKTAFAEDTLYNEAVRLQEEEKYGEAFIRLQLIPDYCDSSKRMEEMKPLIYQSANDLIENNELTENTDWDEEDVILDNIMKARDLYGMIDPYEDSEEKIHICDSRVEQSFDNFYEDTKRELDKIQDIIDGKTSATGGKNKKTKPLILLILIIVIAVIFIIVNFHH